MSAIDSIRSPELRETLKLLTQRVSNLEQKVSSVVGAGQTRVDGPVTVYTGPTAPSGANDGDWWWRDSGGGFSRRLYVWDSDGMDWNHILETV